MPQLKSGRCVGISPDPLLHKLKTGSDAEVSAVIVAYRLTVNSPRDLTDYLTVTYFREGEVTPPNAPAYDSGFLVQDVRAGKAGWDAEEIEEFRGWLETNTRIQAWIAQQFDVVNEAIKTSLVWDTPLWDDDESEKSDHQI